MCRTPASYSRKAVSKLQGTPEIPRSQAQSIRNQRMRAFAQNLGLTDTDILTLKPSLAEGCSAHQTEGPRRNAKRSLSDVLGCPFRLLYHDSLLDNICHDNQSAALNHASGLQQEAGLNAALLHRSSCRTGNVMSWEAVQT